MTEVATKPDAKGEGRVQGSDRFHDVRFGGRMWAANYLAEHLSPVSYEGLGPHVLDLTVSVGQTSAVYEELGFNVLGVDKDKDATRAQFHMKAERFLDKLGEDKLPSVRCIDWEPYGVVAGTEVWFALLRNLHKFKLPLLIVTGCNPRLPATRTRAKMKWDYHWRTTADEVKEAFHARTLYQLWARGMQLQARDCDIRMKWLHEIHDEEQRKIVMVGLVGRI